MSASTDHEILLDQQTIEELQPPCDVTYGRVAHRHCMNAAEWIAVIRLHCCEAESPGRRTRLFCQEHHDYWMTHGTTRCRVCGLGDHPGEIISAERL